MRENVQNNPNNVPIGTSTAPIIITSNTVTDVTTLPSIYTKSCISASSPRLVNMQNVTNHNEMVFSPMDVEVSFSIFFLIHR